ncbi:MAG TPA: hypothetical protein VFT32_05750 [Candidatus Eisenbacteria bacterium]|nr:hypothetical protein [Candidatus Eisenbacteria bacterium]
MQAPPAVAQFMYFDSDGDGFYTPNETLNPATTAVDVWLDPSHNRDGSEAVCNSSSAALTIGSYSFILSALGPLTYGSWQDNLGFSLSPIDLVSQQWCHISRSSDVRLSAGRHKLGTLNLSGVSAGSYLFIVASTSISPDASTGFGTDCEGLGGDNLYVLGRDWMDVGHLPYPTDAATSTSWGSIKARYR